MMKFKTFTIIVLLSLYFSIFKTEGQPTENLFKHPRGIITPIEVEKIRERITREPFSSWYRNIERNYQRMMSQYIEDSMSIETHDFCEYAGMCAFIYTMTNQQKYAQEAYRFAVKSFTDDEYVNNLVSFGLTRATVLQFNSIAYDLCFHAWNTTQRKFILDKLYDLMVSVSSNMGYEGNYSIESNWMGVRWGSVTLAALVWDDYEVINGKRTKSASIPFVWDGMHRLEDQTKANITANGWNVESMGYHFYNWSFVGPAIITLQNNHTKYELSEITLEQFSPHAVNSMWAIANATVAINHRSGKGMKADLADDNPSFGLLPFSLALRLYPEYQLPALKWFLDYLIDTTNYSYRLNGLFFSLAFYPEHVVSINPEEPGWLNYHDKEQGITLFRNRFRDSNDIVAAFTATSKRAQGHQGPDNLTFRIIGLGTIWAIGAGRTGEVQGQTNLFPGSDFEEYAKTNTTGTLLDHKFYKDGSGYAMATGSCMKVTGHNRYFEVDFSMDSIAPGVFIISDTSVNGELWRMNTPEFNKVNILKDGFMIISPDSATLKATFYNNMQTLTINQGIVRYGGSTINNNSGICYKGKCYENNISIDVSCKKKIIAVLTIEPKGKEHPEVTFFIDQKVVKVGGKGYFIRNW